MCCSLALYRGMAVSASPTLQNVDTYMYLGLYICNNKHTKKRLLGAFTPETVLRREPDGAGADSCITVLINYSYIKATKSNTL